MNKIASFSFFNHLDPDSYKSLRYSRKDGTKLDIVKSNKKEMVSISHQSLQNNYYPETKFSLVFNQSLSEFTIDNKKRKEKYITSPISIEFKKFPHINFGRPNSTDEINIDRYIDAKYDIKIDDEFSAYRAINDNSIFDTDLSNVIEVYPKDSDKKTIFTIEPEEFITLLSHSEMFLYTNLFPFTNKYLECFNPICLDEKYENPYTINKYKDIIITTIKDRKIKLQVNYDDYGILQSVKNKENGNIFIPVNYTSINMDGIKISSKYPLIYNPFDHMLMDIDNICDYTAEESIYISKDGDIEYHFDVYH